MARCRDRKGRTASRPGSETTTPHGRDRVPSRVPSLPQGLDYTTIGFEGMQALLKQAMDSVPKEYAKIFGERDDDGNWKNAKYEKQYMKSEPYEKPMVRYDLATQQNVFYTVEKTRSIPTVETLDYNSYVTYQKALEDLSDDERGEKGQNERIVVTGNGLFTEWVGYAPVMKPGADPGVDVEDYQKNVRFDGSGQTGRIMGMYIQHKMIEGAGWAECEQPAYSRRLWDDRGSWMKAPTIRSVVDMAMTIALSSVSGGVGGMLLNASLNMIDDAVFTMLDVANGMDLLTAAEGLAKKAVTSVATSAVSGVANGFAPVKGAANNATGFMSNGLKGTLGLKDSVIGATLLKGAEVMTTNVTTSAINAVSLKGLVTGGDAFDENAFKEGAFGKSAMASVMSGMAGTAVTTGLNSYALTDGLGRGLEQNTFHTKSIQSFNGLAGGLASSAATYAMTGNAKLNVMNFRDIAQAFNLDFFKSKQNPGDWNSVGMLEMNFGKDGFNMNMGMGGTDVSASLLAASAYGFRDMSKITYAKASYKFGDDRGISKLNAINKLAVTGANGNAENKKLAEALWERKVKSKFADLGANEFGRYDEKNKDTILLSNALRGNTDEASAKLASVMSHEGYHQDGGNVEAFAYMTGLDTYNQINKMFNLTPEEAFSQGMVNGVLNRQNWTGDDSSVSHCLITLTGQIVDDHRDGLYMEVPLDRRGKATAAMFRDPAFKDTLNPRDAGGLMNYSTADVYLGTTGDKARDFAIAMNLGKNPDQLTESEIALAKGYLTSLGYTEKDSQYALKMPGKILNSVLMNSREYGYAISNLAFPGLRVQNVQALESMQKELAGGIDDNVDAIKSGGAYRFNKDNHLYKELFEGAIDLGFDLASMTLGVQGKSIFSSSSARQLLLESKVASPLLLNGPSLGGMLGFDGVTVAAGKELSLLSNGANNAAYRLTQDGDMFIHYGYAEQAVGWAQGARPGTYAGNFFGNVEALSGSQAQNFFNSPRDRAPPNAYYIIKPPVGTIIQGPGYVMPAYGRDSLGLRPENIFTFGTPKGSVYGPYSIPLR